MQDYEIRRGHSSNIEGDKLNSLVKEVFGSAKEHDDGTIETSFGALVKLTVRLNDKKTVTIDTVMDTKVDASTAEETRKKYFAFLDRVTGFTSKERAKRLQKKAKEGKL